MKNLILAKVFSCNPSNDPKDLAKGLSHIVVVEGSKRIGDSVVPDYIKAKSLVALTPSTTEAQLLEVEMFNIGGQNGGRVQTYYRIIRKSDIGSKK
jgi:hypothetical protein